MNAAARIHRLSLNGFRNYRSAALATSANLVVLTGPNGAGKTNLLEAISFFSPGRGLRRARLDEIGFATHSRHGGDGGPRGGDRPPDRGRAAGRNHERHRPWAVAAEVDGALGLAKLGTGLEPSISNDAVLVRACRIDREPVASASAFADHMRVVWLVPEMDGLFLGPASERRRFLDRLVLAVDASHAGRVAGLDRALRSRNRLLESSDSDPRWLDAAEREAAALGVAVAAARIETVRRLAGALAARPSPRDGFPGAEIALDGWLETVAMTLPAGAAEDCYRAVLKDNRARDAQAGRTLAGPHLTDLAVFYREKGGPAREASTGEQKALLIGLVLAHAALVADMTATAPVVLLDEVVAHLDPGRRRALFDALDAIGAQVWMTGADPAAFADVARRADIIDVRTLSGEAVA